MSYLGIDPGMSGAIVEMQEDGTVAIDGAHKMPETLKEIAELLIWCSSSASGLKLSQCCIEKVHAMPVERYFNGRLIRQGIASTAKFMQGYGSLLMGLTMAGIPFEEVPTVTWQRYMHCLTHGHKNVSKTKAQQLFPHIKVTHWNADALLIAKYCREKNLGLLPPPVKVVRVLNRQDGVAEKPIWETAVALGKQAQIEEHDESPDFEAF